MFFYDLVVFQSTYTLHLPYPFIHLLELSFHISAVVNNTAVHLAVYVSFGHSDGKESACNAGHPGSIPGSGRFPGEGNGKPLQYSCLENPHGQRSLAPSYSPWGCKELDTTERLTLSLGMRGAIMAWSLDFPSWDQES